MIKRLVWNFEIDCDNPIPPGLLSPQEKDDVRWERRFFWPEDKIITLYGLDSSCLNLSGFELKPRSDVYFILADSEANIKMRRGELLYKPLLKQEEHCYGFAKKIPLDGSQTIFQYKDHSAVDLTLLRQQVQEFGKRVEVNKETLTYKFLTKPRIKLELARLDIEGDIYFSACIEGRSLSLVQSISKHLLKGQKSCDYVSYLKTIRKL